MKRCLLPLAAALVLAPGAALAHPGHDEALTFAAGLAHPLGGLDHLLAGLAVGLIAGLRGGRALWAVPLAFLGMVGAGAGLAWAGAAPPFVEAGVLASLAVFGGLLLVGRGLPTGVLVAVTGAFAAFHGFAHGAEAPGTGTHLAYGAGFLAATAGLLAVGLGLGRLAARLPARRRASVATPSV